VKTKTVKKSARFLIEKYYRYLTIDFQINKNFCDEIALIPSKKLRNKIAGFVTHLMKRMQKGPVSGISVKLQEDIQKIKVEKNKSHELVEKLNSFQINKEIKLLVEYLKKPKLIEKDLIE
jgi:ribosomal protein S17E